MPEPQRTPKPALDVAALGAKASAWFQGVFRALGAVIGQARVGLGRAAGQISHPATRDFLVGVLMPKQLPAQTGDALSGMEGRLRMSGEHSGAHSQPTPEQLRSSGAHSQPSPEQLRTSGSRAAPKRPQRMGGTFTPAAAPASGPKRSLTGGSQKISEDEVLAIKHDAQRRKEEARARAVIDKFRGKLGKFKLEKLGELPRTFAPAPLAEFRQAFPAVPMETLQLLTPLVVGLSRDVCDRAAIRTGWSEAERMAFVNAIEPASRERLRPALDALVALPGEARQALLRLPRAPVGPAVDALAQKWATLPAEEVRSVALALAQFYGNELATVIRAAAPPVKIAPKGIRG
ncbi:MAG: hypothetical protein M3Y59_05730 [Myxococcota bacterium]|nr:hypothetical protein [Myxococcota bacterium]